MVEWKKLGEVCSIKRGNRVTKSDLIENGKFPVISGGVNPLGYIDKYNREPNTITIAQYGSAGYIDLQKGRFWANDVCYSLYPNRCVSNMFLYYSLKNRQKDIYSLRTNAVPAHLPQKELSEVVIPIPSLAEQERIVGILDTFTASIDNLKEQIAQRRKQYEYYRDQLLDLEGKEGVEMKTLGEICDTLSGFPFDSSKFSEDGIRLMRGMNVKRGYFDFSVENNKYWKSADGLEKYLLESNDIIISMDGSLVGRSFCYLTSKHLPMLLVQRVARVRTKENYKYIYFNICQRFPDYVDKKKTAGAIPHISMKDINNFIIPIPSLSEQERIVSILATFESSIQNLEAQLKERQKQYEYYRNKLLTFGE